MEGRKDVPSPGIHCLQEKRPEDLARAATAIRLSRLKGKEQFESRFSHRLKQESYEPGDLVLVRNTAIEKELNRKTKPRYLGPYEVVRRTQGGSYVVKELSGELSRAGIAAFRLLKYNPRTDNLASLPSDPISSVGGREDMGTSGPDIDGEVESDNEGEDELDEDND